MKGNWTSILPTHVSDVVCYLMVVMVMADLCAMCAKTGVRGEVVAEVGRCLLVGRENQLSCVVSSEIQEVMCCGSISCEVKGNGS